MNYKTVSNIALGLSFIAAVIAIIDSTRSIGVWLSATSWLVIAGVLGIWAIYFLICDNCCKVDKK